MEPLGSLGNLARLLRGPVSKGKGGEEKGGVGWKKGEVEEGDEEDGTRRTTRTRRTRRMEGRQEGRSDGRQEATYSTASASNTTQQPARPQHTSHLLNSLRFQHHTRY